MKRNTTTILISLLAVLGLVGLSIWINLDRRTPPTASQRAQGVPLDSPLAGVAPGPGAPVAPIRPLDSPLVAQPVDPSIVPVVPFTGTLPVIPTVEPSPMPTWDVNLGIYEPTATLTQKEEVVFDSVNGITLTLQPGFHAQLPRLPSEMLIRNFDIGEDPRMNVPADWVIAFIGIGNISNQDSFEQFVMARHQMELDAVIGSGTDFQIGELQSYKLGPYEGYAYAVAGTREFPRNFTGTTFIKSQLILIPLDAGRFAQVHIQNVDSPVLAKLMQSLQTLQFVPAALLTATASPISSLNQTPIFKPTATLTQKEEVVFDPVNGITITLQPGLYRQLLVTDAGANLYFRNFATREDVQEGWPANWIVVMLDVRVIPAGAGLEQIATASRQNQIDVSHYQESRFEYEALEPIQLGLYRGYAYKSSGQAVDAPFARDQTIDLLLDDGHYAHINVSNTDSTDFAKVMMSLGTLQFAPPALTP